MDENNEVKDVAVLEDKIKTIANPLNTNVEKITPVSIMENSLSAFMTDVFNQVREEEVYQQAIKQQILANLPTMKNSELIALMTSASTNKNDLISKVISPTMGLMTAAQQNELQERKEAAKEKEMTVNNGNITNIAATSPVEVLQGLKALFDIARSTEVKPAVTN